MPSIIDLSLFRFDELLREAELKEPVGRDHTPAAWMLELPTSSFCKSDRLLRRTGQDQIQKRKGSNKLAIIVFDDCFPIRTLSELQKRFFNRVFRLNTDNRQRSELADCKIEPRLPLMQSIKR